MTDIIDAESQVSQMPVGLLELMANLDPNQRKFARAFLECSDEIRQWVLKMYVLAVNRDISELVRKRALGTIADALFLNPHKNRYGMDLAESEGEAAAEHPGLKRQIDRMDEEEQTFSDRLRDVMLRKCISQEQLAKLVGCTQPAISNMLNRQCRPQKKTIMRLAQSLNVDPRDLWPDLEVLKGLDAIREFHEDSVMTAAEAEALHEAQTRAPISIPRRRLPSKRSR